MKYLKEIAKVVNKNKTKRLRFIGDEQKEKSKLNDLYNGILENDFTTDLEASKYLYEGEKINPNYRNLKSRLEKRLINTLFLIDVNQSRFSDYQVARHQCYKNLAAVKILIGKSSRMASLKLSEKTLNQAIKFHFTEIAISLLKDLRTFYGTVVGDKQKFESYNYLLQEYQINYKFENEALEMYTLLASNYSLSKSTKPELINQAKDYSKTIESYLQTVPSLNFKFYAYLVLVITSEIESNFEKTITVCNSAINEIQKFENISNTHLFTFLFKKLTSLIQIKRYNEAEITVEKCLELQQTGGINWLIALQFYFILLFRSQNFQKAYELYRDTEPMKKSKDVPNVLKEIWRVIDAYLYYFISKGKIQLRKGEELKKFKIRKFLNDVPVLSKDQRGMKISILILHLLFLLDQKKYNDVISRTETLQAFVSKHLRNDESYRNNCFIKMLLQIPTSNFNRIALERRSKKYYEKLKSRPLEIAKQPTEIEMVPYEILWKYVLDSLDKK